jgi:hypothetical protein
MMVRAIYYILRQDYIFYLKPQIKPISGEETAVSGN